MYAQTSRRGQGRARAYSKCFRTYLSEKASDPRHSIRQTFPRSLKMLESWIRSVVKGKLFNPLYFALYGSGTACCIWSLSAIVLIIRIVFFIGVAVLFWVAVLLVWLLFLSLMMYHVHVLTCPTFLLMVNPVTPIVYTSTARGPQTSRQSFSSWLV